MQIAKKMQIPMNGKTFNECWFLSNVEISDNYNVVVNFINQQMINVFVNGSKVWSIIGLTRHQKQALSNRKIKQS